MNDTEFRCCGCGSSIDSESRHACAALGIYTHSDGVGECGPVVPYAEWETFVLEALGITHDDLVRQEPAGR
jgi:hypothetical protein